jgi:DNA-binding transcriptional LysR family regulator
MDLNRVAAFVRVAQDGTFTAAARALGVPKSSVSRSVAQLEQELGIRLLHRTTRKLRLTDAGTVFYERVARALTDIDEARATASEMQSEPRGTVKITAPPDFGTSVLGPILARFARKHPSIVVDISLSGRLVDLVAEGFDLAVRAGPLRDSSLVVRRFGKLDSALYVSPKYVARRGAPRTVAELADHEAVLFRGTEGRATWALDGPGGEVRSVDVTGPVACDDLAFAHKATLSGAGVALLPRFLCARQEASGRLVRVLPEWIAGDAVLHVVYPSIRFVPQRVVLFREFLTAALSSFERECRVQRGPRGGQATGAGSAA